MSSSRVRGRNTLLPFQKGFIASCRSVIELYEYLKDRCDIQFILTHRLTQDCLESYFSKIRGIGGFNDHPTPLSCTYRIRCLLVGGTDGNIVSAAVNTDAAEDGTYTLSASILSRLKDREVKSSSELCNDEPIDNELSSDLSVEEEDGFTFVSGFVAAKLRNVYPDLGCPTFKADQVNSWLQKLSKGGLCQPSEKWLGTCKQLESIFKCLNKVGIMQKNPLSSLLKRAKDDLGDEFRETACRLFFRTRIFIRLKTLNAENRRSALLASAKKKTRKFLQ